MKTPGGDKRTVTKVFGGCSAGLLGLILTPILVNVLGGVAFHNHPSYDSAQGLGTLFFFLSILSAPLGALYWAVVSGMREAENARRVIVTGAAIYILLVLAGVLAIGWSYAASYGRPR
jgi:hypothetical protein